MTKLYFVLHIYIHITGEIRCSSVEELHHCVLFFNCFISKYKHYLQYNETVSNTLKYTTYKTKEHKTLVQYYLNDSISLFIPSTKGNTDVYL